MLGLAAKAGKPPGGCSVFVKHHVSGAADENCDGFITKSLGSEIAPAAFDVGPDYPDPALWHECDLSSKGDEVVARWPTLTSYHGDSMSYVYICLIGAC